MSLEHTEQDNNKIEKPTEAAPVQKVSFEKIKPVENVSVEDLPNKISGLIAKATDYEALLSGRTVIDVDNPGMKLGIAFQLKGVQPMPMKIEVKGTKEDIASQIEQKIQSIISEKGLTGPQNIEFLNAFRTIYDTDNPDTTDYGLGTIPIVSQY